MNTECLQQPAIEEREPEEDPKPYFSPNWANRQTLTLGRSAVKTGEHVPCHLEKAAGGIR